MMTQEDLFLGLFFEEKEIPIVVWDDVSDFNGRRHIIDSGVVISRIKALPRIQKIPVIHKLGYLDYHELPVLPFLEHLARYFMLTSEFTLCEQETER